MLGALLASLALVAGCAGAGALGAEEGVETVTVAIVSNPQMEDAISLVGRSSRRSTPASTCASSRCPENEARAKITASVATGGGEFDVVMISQLRDAAVGRERLARQPAALHRRAPTGYDADDFIPTMRESLSYEGDMYSVPFYGESSFLVYRKDLFEQAGLDDARAADLAGGRASSPPS